MTSVLSLCHFIGFIGLVIRTFITIGFRAKRWRSLPLHFTPYTLHRGFAALLPPVSIGTSLEPDWNLIGTSSEPHRRDIERIPRDKYKINDRQTLRNQRRLATNNIDNKTTCQWHTKRRKATKNIWTNLLLSPKWQPISLIICQVLYVRTPPPVKNILLRANF